MGGKIALLCKTEEHANMLLTYLSKKNILWASGDSLLPTNQWNRFKEKTCYALDTEGLFYGSYRFYKKRQMNEYVICVFNPTMVT